MALVLDGSLAAASIRLQIAEEVRAHVAKGHRAPGLVAILVGEDGASQTYVGAKKTACDEVGLFAVFQQRFRKRNCWKKLKKLTETKPLMD